MTLLAAWLQIVQGWKKVFPQQRSFRRALRQALGGLVCLGRRTITRIIWTNGDQNGKWAPEYLLHSRCPWDPQELFEPVLRAPSPGAGDAMSAWLGMTPACARPGRGSSRLSSTRSPLSPLPRQSDAGPAFPAGSLLVPLYRGARPAPAPCPSAFRRVLRSNAPSQGRPGRMEAVPIAAKAHNLSQEFVKMMGQLRQALDEAGAALKILALAVDGSFCNRTVFSAIVKGVEIIARARKDAVLCFGAEAGSRRFYDTHKFTPKGAPRPGPALEDDPALLRRQATSGALQGGLRGPLARRRPPTPPASVGRGSHPLPQTQERSLLLPSTGLPLTTDLNGTAHTLLQIYSIAGRSRSSPRRKGHPGRGPGPDVEPHLGTQATGPGRGGVQRPAAGILIASALPADPPTPSSPPGDASEKAFLPGSDHPAPQGND